MLSQSIGLHAFLLMALAIIAYAASNNPKMPHDANTAADCKWWIDNDGSNKCEDIPDIWGIDMVDWLMWVSTDSHDSQE